MLRYITTGCAVGGELKLSTLRNLSPNTVVLCNGLRAVIHWHQALQELHPIKLSGYCEDEV